VDVRIGAIVAGVVCLGLVVLGLASAIRRLSLADRYLRGRRAAYPELNGAPGESEVRRRLTLSAIGLPMAGVCLVGVPAIFTVSSPDSLLPGIIAGVVLAASQLGSWWLIRRLGSWVPLTDALLQSQAERDAEAAGRLLVAAQSLDPEVAGLGRSG